MTIKILLVDDHALVRAGLHKLITGFKGCQIIGEAANGREAIQMARTVVPDIVLLDITMPELNGLDACEKILTESPALNVILLSMHANEVFVGQGLRAGAKGYVLKDAAPEELEIAIRAVANGGIFLSARVSGSSAHPAREGGLRSGVAELSQRQREVLQLIAEGHSTRDIAERLHLSVKTIETHRAQIMARLDIRDVAGLTRYAIRAGIIVSDS
jgi:DNA-binding NarL/FixJ family response regulator